MDRVSVAVYEVVMANAAPEVERRDPDCRPSRVTDAGRPGSVCTTVHPGGVRPAHPRDHQHRPPPVQREALPYVVVGAVAAGERSSRAIASAGVRAAGVAMWPAGVWWRSPLGAPVRNRVAAASDALERSGRELVARTSDQARVSGSRELKRLGDQLNESGLTDEIIDKLLSSGAFDRIVAVVINHPATEALVVNVVDEPALERLVSRVMDSRLVDGITAQLLASEEMQAILDYVTRSPELRAALAHQTAGMAEDVAIGVRSRTYNADAAAERFARRLLKRRSKAEPQQ